MFPIIQACCHAVVKVNETAFPFFHSDMLLAEKPVSADCDVSGRLTITTTQMENAFKIKERGVTKRRI